MLSKSPPKQQPDPACQAVYIWQRIDPRNNRLIRDKLLLAREQLQKEIEKASAEIRFANRLNINKTGVEITVSQMWEQKIDDYAASCYGIFCHQWDLLGHRKTGAFVRVSLEILLRHVERIGGSAAHQARVVHRRRGGLGQSLEDSYDGAARTIVSRWRAKLDIEARELDLAAVSPQSPHTPAHLVLSDRQQPQEVPTDEVEYEGFVGSGDYRTIRFRGKEHRLTRNQAHIVKLLHDAHQRRTRAVGKQTLLAAIEAETSRVRDSFKKSPLWGTLVIANRKPRGTYQLNID